MRMRVPDVPSGSALRASATRVPGRALPAYARAAGPGGGAAPMARDPPAPDSPGAAHLTIRFALERGKRRNRFAPVLQRLRALVSSDPGSLWRPAVALRIARLGGEVVVALDEAAPVVRMELPPGRYQVSARRAARVRSYTMTLTAGESLELQLRFEADPR